jgi:gamma-glutamylcyclotransferase (GGCT)/AIG2-like uncharacterized protein YtfP
LRLFLYGTLLDDATLARHAGDARLPAKAVPATLMHWRRVALRGSHYPTLHPCRSAKVAGALVAAPASAMRRLAAYEGSAYRLTRVVVQTATGKTAARAWIAPGGTRRTWRE